ncbi:MAG: hypothetical protein H6937_05145 [Burkholderiales bacterium]|nr:hypothetical protein [Burkholderiales bacterium]
MDTGAGQIAYLIFQPVLPSDEPEPDQMRTLQCMIYESLLKQCMKVSNWFTGDFLTCSA